MSYPYDEPFRVELEAHRVGEYFGTPVPRGIQDEGDPLKYLIPVNDDYDDGLSSDGGDNADDVVVISSGAEDPIDDDLARITLRCFGQLPASGTVRIELSNENSARVFKSDGSPLVDFVVSLSTPAGDLAPLILDRMIDVWLEGTEKDIDLVISIIYEDGTGQEVNRDEVHALIATFAVIGTDNSAIPLVRSWPADLLLNEASEVEGAPTLPDNGKFKYRVDGLPSDRLQSLTVRAGDGADYYEDEVAASATKCESARFACIYSSLANAAITSAERDRVRTVLDLNAVHNQEAEVITATDFDRIRKRLGANTLYVEQESIQKPIYDSSKPITFNVVDSDRLPQKTKIKWDFTGADDNHPSEEGDAPDKKRIITYSTEADGAANIKLDEHPSNYRKVYTVSAKITFPGMEDKPLTLTRTLRVALAKKKIHTDAAKKFPSGVPSDRVKTDKWLKDTYTDISGGNVTDALPFSNLDAFGEESLDTFAVLNLGVSMNLFQQQRIALGTNESYRDPKNLEGLIEGWAYTMYESKKETRNGNAFPDTRVLGITIPYPTTQPNKGDDAFQYDKPEFDCVVEHERGQLRELKKLKEGSSLPGKIYSAYLDSDAPKVRARAYEAFIRWNQYLRATEDFKRCAAQEANGDVSWNFMGSKDSIVRKFWSLHMDIVAAAPSTNQRGAVAGSLRDMSEQGAAMAGVYALAYAHAVDVYKNMPNEWKDMLELIQDKGYEESDRFIKGKLFLYRIYSPEESVIGLSKP